MERLRTWQLFSFLVLAMMIPASAYGGYREDLISQLVEYLRTSADDHQKARVEKLHQSFLNQSVAQDQTIVSLSLGIHYVESNPRLALQYLTSARLATTNSSPLYPVITYYVAAARFRAGSAGEAQTLVSDLLKQNIPTPLRKLVLALGIESAFSRQDHASLISLFEQYTTRFSLGRRQESIARQAIEALTKNQSLDQATELMEDLARAYPMTSNSRWAFHRLLDLSCDQPKNPGTYHFSLKLLSSLARNSTDLNGLDDFIVNQIERPVRVTAQEVRPLSPQEKYQFLYETQLFKQALSMANDLYADELTKPQSEAIPVYLLDLARIYIRMNEPMTAAAYLSRFVLNYPYHDLKPKALELLGDALRYAGTPKAAASVYAEVLTHKDSPLIRWYHFWSTYRSGHYNEALALLERPRYVEPRDGDPSSVLDYWQGKILEKLGRKDQASDLFRKILNQHGNTFYGAMTARFHPELAVGGEDPASLPRTNREGLSLAAKLLPRPSPDSTTWPTKDPQLLSIADLIDKGLIDIAALQLQTINWDKVTSDDEFAAISRMAYAAGDYNPFKRSKFGSLRDALKISSHYPTMIQSQKSHKSLWQLLYPLAYQQIVFPVAHGIKISPYLVLSIMRAESFYNKDAHSPVGAYGLMQLMPYTATRIAQLLRDNDFDAVELGQPQINITYGSYYLDRLLRYYGGNPYVAVAAYNAGPVAVNKWLRSCTNCAPDEFVEAIPYRETRRYVREVMRNFAHYTNVYLDQTEGLPIVDSPLDLPAEEIF